ncbi:hypothetical protein A6F68_01403 [Tsuneonella dongtanensis]|uniref:Uncharacterized protein n=1 Tax=Tsuneonella dongtanensis TaxID=692370 RepID=A0A1B2ACN9_9SPHN|nr:hypothetical protein [Tsuneonella dongtanensis]ANY19919.1 hypothetical protein A6F68_01403 [Tsuneonella dongtanensis]
MSYGITPQRRRGQPLAMLAVLFAAWIGARAAFWQAPDAIDPARPEARTFAHVKKTAAPLTEAIRSGPSAEGTDDRPAADNPGLPAGRGARPVRVGDSVNRAQDWTAPTAIVRIDVNDDPPPRSPGGFPIQVASGGSSPSAPADRRATGRRWRVDGWYAWRSGGSRTGLANGRPAAAAYGGTQGGLVARRSLASRSGGLDAYLRMTHAPEGIAQSDFAVGLGARPLARIPVRLQAEARATRAGGRTELRPAAALVTELAPLALPFETKVETYVQAGWVGGDFATGFVDGQARLDRAIVQLGAAEVRMGAGVWGGAQRLASRLDVGPGLTLDMRESGVPARISIDYRFQVAGTARPGDGLALTLSTGF